MRISHVARKTRETDIVVDLLLDEPGEVIIETPFPFFSHLLSQVGTHGRMGLHLVATGDWEVDAHHLTEDTGSALGMAIHDALGERRGIERFSSETIALDEALVRVSMDCSGRGMSFTSLGAERAVALGTPSIYLEHIEEFLRALASHAGLTLHIASLAGLNTHHILEATAKGLGRGLHKATRVVSEEIPSTKGTLDG
jgi:imidazoleglycerol-phosphate dehydratase